MASGSWPCAAAASLAAIVSLPAHAADTISKTEIRRDSPALTHRRLRDMVWSLFKMEDMRRKESPRAALRNIALSAEPTGTHVPGLCRRDTLWVEFAPPSGPLAGADTPTRPTGFTATSVYGFKADPDGSFDAIVDYQRLPSETRCTGVANSRYFRAENERVATDGAWVLSRLQQALRERKDFALTCDRWPASLSCEQRIRGIGVESLSSVERCETAESNQSCLVFELSDERVRVLVTSGTQPGRPFGEPLSAHVDGMVIIADTLID